MLGQVVLIAGLWMLGIGVAVVLVRRLTIRARARARMLGPSEPDDASLIADDADDGGATSGLRLWLIRAGIRRRGALPWYVVSTGAGLVGGGFVAWAFVRGGGDALLLEGLSVVPGGVGEVFLPAVWIAPWVVWFGLALGPTLVVRRARRQRVEQIEQDLPIVLDLLATLGEAGVGFDAALDRVCDTRLGDRPLVREFRRFQADLLGGRSRIEALRRLGHRVDLLSTSVLVSALVQAEQMGMGLAATLKRQADDLRERRRERANAFAATLPVKLMFPLMACFLPGIFLWTLGPIFQQFFRLADTIIRTRSL